MKNGAAHLESSVNLYDQLTLGGVAAPTTVELASERDHAGRCYSRYQLDVFEDVERGTGHTVVLAYAGSGKTTTILEALRRVRTGLTILMVAFNKSIERELAKRAPKGVEVKTVHSHGFSAVRRAFRLGKDAVDDFKSAKIVEACFAEGELLEGEGEAICKLVGVAKDTLTAADAAIDLARRAGTTVDRGTGHRTPNLVAADAADELPGKHRGYAAALEALDGLIDRFGIELPEEEDVPAEERPVAPPTESWDGWEDEIDPVEAAKRLRICRRALVVLARSLQITTTIDFSDMCWLPVVLNLRVWAFDRVFVDETQDLSPCQIELLKRFVKPSGRICAVGDENQAIYTWRGADEHGIPKLVEELRARKLPLSITYRCPLAVVRLAQRVVPDLQAAPDAPEGVVDYAGTRDRLWSEARPGDMVVSRKNAPLIGLCLGLLVRGKRAAIMGRNIGEGLVRLVEKSRAKDVEALEEWIEGWCAKETARLTKKKRDTQEAEDKKECVLALCRDAESVAEVLRRAEELFSDKSGEPKVLLGTTHKLKGMEANRVWMLQNYREKRGGEESRIWYVAVTRAKRELVMTNLPKEDDSKREVAA